MIDVLIPTCDQYIHYIEALQFSAKFFWPQHDQYKFIILGYQKPEFKLDTNFSFVSLGKQRGPSFWAEDLISFLNTYDKEYFIYGNDDCCLTYMDNYLFNLALQITLNDKTIGRFALMPEGKKEPMSLIKENIHQFNIYNYNNDSNYRLSLGWSIYRKDFFLEFCKPGMSPWDFEKSSCGGESRTAITDNYQVLTFTPRVLLDAAFFARKNLPHPIDEWDKAYYGHDLKGEYKKLIGHIIHKKHGIHILD